MDNKNYSLVKKSLQITAGITGALLPIIATELLIENFFTINDFSERIVAYCASGLINISPNLFSETFPIPYLTGKLGYNLTGNILNKTIKRSDLETRTEI